MSGYPATNEILEELESEGGSGMEADPAGEIAPEGNATDGGQQQPETPFLDFDQYKSHHLTYKANGQEFKEPLEKIIQHASMGRDYAQKVAAMKQQQGDYDNLKQELEGLSKWKQYDEYARENPQWAEYVEQQWQNRDTVGNPDLDPNDPQVQQYQKLQQSLNERLNTFDQRFGPIEEHYKSFQQQAEDTEFETQINDVKSKFDFIDFDRVDDGTGKSVEMNVLEHMQQTGVNNFRAAFLDLYQDQILQNAESRALEKTANDRQKQAKQGIVGVSTQAPTSKAPASGRPRNDQDATKMALDFLERQG